MGLTLRADITGWRKVAGDRAGGAILDLGDPGQFDEAWVTCPTVVQSEGVYRLWYSSYYDSKMGPGGIGLAVSRDGCRWQRENKGRPVLGPGPEGSLDGGQVMGPEVLHDGALYRMWYTGMAREWHSSGFGYYRIFLARSRDGVHWTRENSGLPVFDVGPEGAFDEVQAGSPSILREQGRYRMWYAAWSPRHGHTVCLAESEDGVRWRRANDSQPVRGLSPQQAYGQAVCRRRGEYVMLYMALEAEPGLYAASSADGVSWRMVNGGRPVLAPGSSGDFDDAVVGHPFLLDAKGRLQAWYTGYRREAGGVRGWRLRIGLAEEVRPSK